jgi:general secretion pathway protein I
MRNCNCSPQRRRGRRDYNYIFLLRGQKYINRHEESFFCLPASHRGTKFAKSLRAPRLCDEMQLVPSRSGGFTLLEIMIALAIIGGLLITLLYTLNYHLGIAGRHEFATVATLLARDKIEEVEANPAAGTGAFPEPYSDYRFAAVVKGSPFPGISEVSVTVSRNNEHLELTDFIGSRDETNKGF